MAIWEIQGVSNDYTTLYPLDDDDLINEVFLVDGSSKGWLTPPDWHLFLRRSKKNKNRSPILVMWHRVAWS